MRLVFVFYMADVICLSSGFLKLDCSLNIAHNIVLLFTATLSPIAPNGITTWPGALGHTKVGGPYGPCPTFQRDWCLNSHIHRKCRTSTVTTCCHFDCCFITLE